MISQEEVEVTMTSANTIELTVAPVVALMTEVSDGKHCARCMSLKKKRPSTFQQALVHELMPRNWVRDGASDGVNLWSQLEAEVLLQHCGCVEKKTKGHTLKSIFE